MHTLLVYESLWGNTAQIARAIARVLERSGTVDLLDTDEGPRTSDGHDLLVVGGPTHAFSMSRATTRQHAVGERGAPHAPQDGIREWLDQLAPPRTPIPAVAFDTRVAAPRLPGSAAAAARRHLHALGFTTAVPPKTFHVHGYEGPLVDGELERARSWTEAWLARLAINA